MPSSADIGRLHRSLGALSMGVAQATEEHREGLAPTAAGDMVQVVRVPLSGKVGATPLQTFVPVTFEHPFGMTLSPSDTNLPTDTPHFNAGIEMQTDIYVALDVQLKSWAQDGSGWFVGAQMRLIAWAPGAPKKVTYKGVAHLSFYGYAAPSADDSQG